MMWRTFNLAKSTTTQMYVVEQAAPLMDLAQNTVCGRIIMHAAPRSVNVTWLMYVWESVYSIEIGHFIPWRVRSSSPRGEVPSYYVSDYVGSIGGASRERFADGTVSNHSNWTQS